jgi:hypothetical protein
MPHSTAGYGYWYRSSFGKYVVQISAAILKGILEFSAVCLDECRNDALKWATVCLHAYPYKLAIHNNFFVLVP